MKWKIILIFCKINELLLCTISNFIMNITILNYLLNFKYNSSLNIYNTKYSIKTYHLTFNLKKKISVKNPYSLNFTYEYFMNKNIYLSKNMIIFIFFY